MVYIVESLGQKLQPLLSNLCLSLELTTKLLSFSVGRFTPDNGSKMLLLRV